MSRPSTPLNLLVSLETIDQNHSALERLAELAALFQARLQGIYVEDEELLAIADFPFTEEVQLHARQANNLDREKLEQQMRSAGRQAEMLLARIANRWNIDWRFQRIRGKVTAELFKAAQQADIVSMLAGNRSSYRGRFLPTDSGNLEAFLERPCIIVPPTINAGNEIIVIVDRDQGLERLLEPARLISQQGKRPLIIILQAAQNDSIYDQVKAFFADHHLAAQILLPRLQTIDELINLLNLRNAHMVFIHAQNLLLTGSNPAIWSRRLTAPIMLIP